MIQSLIRCIFDKTTRRMIGASRFHRETMPDGSTVDHYDFPKYYSPDAHVAIDTDEIPSRESVKLGDDLSSIVPTTPAEANVILSERSTARAQKFLNSEVGQAIIRELQIDPPRTEVQP